MTLMSILRSRCALKLSVRWGILTMLIGYAIIGIANEIVPHQIHFNRVVTTGDMRDNVTIPNINAWLAPAFLVIPAMLLALLCFTEYDLQQRRNQRSTYAWNLGSQMFSGTCLGVLASWVVPLIGIASCVLGSFACMLVITFFATIEPARRFEKRHQDLWQILAIPATVALIVSLFTTLTSGPIAAGIYAATIMLTSTATFALFWVPSMIWAISKPLRGAASSTFRKTMLECDPSVPGKC